jgi:hypothetical protein
MWYAAYSEEQRERGFGALSETIVSKQQRIAL